MKSNLLPTDTYIVINKTLLNNEDKNVLYMLYQPIIGGTAISLYFTLWSYLDKLEMMSTEWTHHHLMISLRETLENIVSAREQLEGIGLLKTYVKNKTPKNYVYELYSPLSAHEFFTNPILTVSLYNNIGKMEYEKTVQYFKNYTVDLKDYENITCSFSEVFMSVPIDSYDLLDYDIKRKTKGKLEIEYSIHLNDILGMIPEGILNIRTVNKDIKDFIMKLSFIYNLREETVVELIKNSINEKKAIDKDLLRQNARRYYQFENNGKNPSIVMKTQPENLRSKKDEFSKKAKMIYTFETTSPYEFLRSKYNGGLPSKTDLSILEFLLVDLNLNPGVVNVLIDFVLRTNNQKLVKSYIETIAGQWKRCNIETVEEAMNLAIEETTKKKKSVKKSDIKPDWLGKNIEEEELDENTKKELEEMLKEFK